MRKLLVVGALLVMVVLAACNGEEDEAPLNLDLDLGDTTVETDDTAVDQDVSAPQLSPTPTLPATYTPPAQFLGEHLYLLPVAGAAGQTAVHVVQSGETLAMVGQHYMVAPAQLAQANALSADAQLSPGMVLVIPPPAR